MDFLYPIFLAGTLTAALPVIIHLLTKRQKKRVLFSDLTLLRQVDAEEAPRYRFENLLLMLLRALVFVALALLFAQPVWKEGGAFLQRPGQGTAVALVIDASRSMGASVSGVTRYEKAKQMAIQVIDNLRGEDEVMAVFASSHTRTSHAAPTVFREEVREAVEQSEVTPFASSFTSEVLLAVDALTKSPLSNKEIYLFTDCQKNAMVPATLSWPSGAESITGYFGYLPERLGLPNVEITDLQVTPLTAKPGEPVEVKASLFSTGDEAPMSVEMHLETGPNNRLYRNIPVAQGQTNPVTFGISRSSDDVDHGFIQIQSDALDSDNTVRYALPQARPIRIVLTQGGGGKASLSFLQLALNLLSVHPIIPKIEVDYSEIQEVPDTLSRETVDVVIAVNPGQVTKDWVRSLSAWMREGGNVVLTMGAVAAHQINETMVPDWFPSEIGRWENEEKEAFKPVSFDFSNPWMDRFEKQEEANWQSVKVWGGYEFLDKEDRSTSLRNLMILERGSPLLWQRDVGLGKLSVWMTSLDDLWNDVPRSGLFVALWGEYIRALAESRGLSPSFGAGAQVPIEISRKDDRPTEIRIVGPDDREHVQSVAGPKLTQVIYFSRADQLGFYRVDYNQSRIDRVTPAVFAVNAEPGEADLAALPVEEVEAIFPFPIQRIESREALLSRVSYARFGHRLWPLVLAVVIALMISEAWMGRPT